MTDKKRSKRWIGLWTMLAFAAVAAGAVHYWEYLPYQKTIARQFKSTLESYGLTVTSLEVDRLNQSEVDISNIQLGSEPGLAIGKVSASYSLPQITQFDTLKLHEVNVDDVKAHIYFKDNAWTVSGLEPFMAGSSEPSAALDVDAILNMLPQAAHLKQIALSGADAAWSFSSTLNADFQATPSPTLNATSLKLEGVVAGYQLVMDDINVDAELEQNEQQKPSVMVHVQAKALSASGGDQQLSVDSINMETVLNKALTPSIHITTKHINASAGKSTLTADKADIKAEHNDKKDQWSGTLSAANVVVAGVDTPIPVVQLAADFTVQSNQINATIRAYDAAKTHQARGVVSLPLDNPLGGTLVVQQLYFPWGGGVISLKPVTMPLAFDKPLPLAIKLDKVALSHLLATLGEGKISGTGNISGVLPITYYPDGTVTLQEGKAAALEAGTISVAPSLLPGDNEQLAVARTTLENFHYTKLGISVSSDKEKRSTIHLTLEGNNPDAFDGRQVNLNVNLTGDVLPLIQQSVLPINNLKELLKLQGTP